MDKHILIVEDDQDLVSVYRQSFEAKGYIVSTATSENDVISSLRSIVPDCILLDIMLSDKRNGFDILETIKRNPAYNAIPVILLTNLESEAQTASNIGANAYFVKSETSMEQILETVEKFTQSAHEA